MAHLMSFMYLLAIAANLPLGRGGTGLLLQKVNPRANGQERGRPRSDAKNVYDPFPYSSCTTMSFFELHQNGEIQDGTVEIKSE